MLAPRVYFRLAGHNEAGHLRSRAFSTAQLYKTEGCRPGRLDVEKHGGGLRLFIVV